MLQGFQAGLAWIIGLRKAFSDFDPTKVALFGERDGANYFGTDSIRST